MTEEQEKRIRNAALVYSDARDTVRMLMSMNTPNDEDDRRNLRAEYAVAQVRELDALMALRRAQGFAS